MGEQTRVWAFMLAVVALGVAAALLLLLGSPRERDGHGDDAGATRRTQTVIVSPTLSRARPSAPESPVASSGADVAVAPRGVVRAVRTAVARFAVAYLARESGRMTDATRRVLRATTTGWLWARLREPVRPTPTWRPSPARYEEVSGVSETHRDATLEATVAYRRDGRRLFLSVRMALREGQWRARYVGQ